MLLKSTIIYAPAIVLTRISAVLLLAIATRLIDQTEYGLLTLVVTIGEMTDVALTNWLRISLLRLGGRGEISRGSLMLAARVLIATTALALVVSIGASYVVAPDRWAEFATAVCAYLVVGAVGRLALTVLQMQQRHTAYSMLEFLRAGLQLVLPVAAIAVFPGSFMMVSLGSSLAVLIAGVVASVIAFSRVVAGPPRFTHGEFFAFGVPLIVMALVGFGLHNAERLFLNAYYSAGAVAIFASAYALARQPIDMVANAINMGAFPEVVGKFDEEGPEAAAKLLSHLMALMMRLCLPVAALLVALRTDIVGLILPADYHGHADALFPVIAFSVLCANVTSFVYGDVVHAHKKPWLLVVANGVGSVGTIGFSLWLVPPFAEMGAALALAGGTLASLVACIIISERLTPVPVPWRDLAISSGIALMTGLVAWLSSAAMGDVASVFKLAAGGISGGMIFLVLNGLVHPAETRAFVGKVRARLGVA